MKSGNHGSSFTKAAMVAFNRMESKNDSDASSNFLNDDNCNGGDDGEFGIETGG
jgi:hypothetical protein